jgi:hypothetical protein
MKAQENIKNDELNFQADALTDLSVTDEQADRTEGGEIESRPSSGKLFVATNVGVY